MIESNTSKLVANNNNSNSNNVFLVPWFSGSGGIRRTSFSLFCKDTTNRLGFGGTGATRESEQQQITG